MASQKRQRDGETERQRDRDTETQRHRDTERQRDISFGRWDPVVTALQKIKKINSLRIPVVDITPPKMDSQQNVDDFHFFKTSNPTSVAEISKKSRFPSKIVIIIMN